MMILENKNWNMEKGTSLNWGHKYLQLIHYFPVTFGGNCKRNRSYTIMMYTYKKETSRSVFCVIGWLEKKVHVEMISTKCVFLGIQVFMPTLQALVLLHTCLADFPSFILNSIMMYTICRDGCFVSMQMEILW